MATESLETREHIIKEVGRMSSLLYASLLANMSKERLEEMFSEVDAIIYRLEHMASMNTDPRIKPTTYNALTDKRATVYNKFFNNAMALPITDPVELKAFQIAVYKANGELIDGYQADFAARESLKKSKDPISL